MHWESIANDLNIVMEKYKEKKYQYTTITTADYRNFDV